MELPKKARLVDGLYESATAKPEVMDGTKMAHKEREAIVKNGRALSPGKCDQGTHSSRVRRDDKGEAIRESSRQTICAAASQNR